MIQPLADGRFKIQVWVFFKGSRYKRQDTFTGNLQQAREREKTLWVQLRKELKENDNKREEGCKEFRGIISFCRSQNQFWKSMRFYYKRVERDCGRFPMEERELRARFIKYFASLDRTKSKKGSPLAPWTKNRILEAARKIINFARKHKLMDFDPLASIKKWKTSPRLAELSREEEERLINASKKVASHLHAPLLFSLRNPIRISDIRAMRRENLDLDSMTITYTSKKTNVTAVCNIYPELEEYFRKLPKKCRYLFYYKTRSRYHPLGDIRKSWNAVKKAAKIDPDFRWHDLRHTACASLLRSGVPTSMVQKCGGWKTLSMVQLYHSGGAVEAARIARECVLRQNQSNNTMQKRKKVKPKSVSKESVVSKFKSCTLPDNNLVAA